MSENTKASVRFYQISKLEAIKKRYLRPVMKYPEGIIAHMFDCSYRSAYEPHCDCGLIHDLLYIQSPDDRIVDKIYAFELDDESKPPLTEEEEIKQEESYKLLLEIFDDNIQISPFLDDEMDWEIIEMVFNTWEEGVDGESVYNTKITENLKARWEEVKEKRNNEERQNKRRI